MPIHPMPPAGRRRALSRMAESNREALAAQQPQQPEPEVTDVAPADWPAACAPAWSLVGASRPVVEALYASLTGFLSFPGLEDYLLARAGLEEWPTPRIIAYCLTEEDVRTALLWAQHPSRDWLISVRSGGHNTAGYHLCNGMVIDLSRMKTVSVDEPARLVTCQAGVTFQDLGTALKGKGGLLVPGGTCPTVCVAGFTLGGGYSLASRTYGMCCDRVQQIRVMTWSGAVHVASETQDPELFWALRGGSGGQFGVLLDVTYDAPCQPEFWGFVAQWSLDDAEEVLSHLEQHFTWWVHNKPEKFGYLGALSHLVQEGDPSKVEDECSLAILGMYAGTKAEGMQALAELLGTGSVTLRYDKVADYPTINTELFTLLPYGALDLASGSSMASSGLVEPASDPDWTSLVEVARNMPNPGNLIAMEPYGGAIGARPDSFNAFPHRGMKFDLMVDSFWNPEWQYNKSRSSAQEWLDQALNVLAPAFAGRVYVNYAQPDLLNYRRSYWAQHFGMLLTIKQQMDPQQIFRFPQSISWYPSAKAAPTGVDKQFPPPDDEQG